MIRFSPGHRRLLFLLLALFAIGVFSGLHGFSLPEWHHRIDNSSAPEVLLGKAREIRSDDWFAALPTIFAQGAHVPPFPAINRTLGLGTDMAVHSIKTPSLHFITFFRPHLWGYFLGNDLGMAWHWWALVLGLFYSFFLCFLIVSGNRFVISAAGGVLVAWSPFFQFKSVEYGEIAIFAGLVFVALGQVVLSPSRRVRLLNALVLGWSMGGLALNFYPPSQISLGYLVAFLAAGLLARHRAVLSAQGEWRHRLLCLGVAAVCAGLPLIVFLLGSWDQLQVLMQTEFPGKRFVPGGDYPLWRLFCNNFFLQFRTSDWSPVLNISEYGSFIFFFPALAVWVGYRALRSPREVDWLVVSALVFCLVVSLFVLVGFPRWLSAFTLMSKVPPYRSMVALGIANVFALVGVASWRENSPRFHSVFLGTIWFCFLGAIALVIGEKFKTAGLAWLALWPLLLSLLLCGLLRNNAKQWAMVALAVLSFASSCWFNPLVRGGSRFLYSNPLGQKMLALPKAEKTRWAVFGPMFHANYPRLLGLYSINGTQPFPDFDLWKRFDPEKRFLAQWNRYGHVWFTATEGETTIDSPYLDQVRVTIRPDSPVFEGLQVRYFLVIEPENRAFDSLPQFTRLFSYHHAHIYERNRPLEGICSVSAQTFP